MKYKIHITILILFVLNIFIGKQLKAQIDYKEAPFNKESSLTTLQNEFYGWIENQDANDSIKSKVKKFMRFESFWRDRVASNENYHASFTEYTKAYNSYWQSPYCLNNDKSQWEMVGPFPQGKSNMGFVGAIWSDPEDSNFIIAGSGRNSGLFRTTDGGATWEDVLTPQKLPALGITSFAVSPNKNNNQRVIYASTGGYHYSVGIIKSVDNGKTWQILDNNWPISLFGGYKTRKVVVPQDLTSGQSDILYAIATDKFLKSIDGGLNWTKQSLSSFPGKKLVDLEVNPNNNQQIYVSEKCKRHFDSGTNTWVIDEPAKIYYSNDGGDTWNIISNTLSDAQMLSKANLSVTSNGDLYTYYERIDGSGNKNYRVFKTTDNGNSWTHVQNGNGNKLLGNSSFQVSSTTNNIYHGQKHLYKNHNKVSGVGYGTNTYHKDIRAMQLIPEENNDILLIGHDGGISKSTNQGNTWTVLNGYGSTGLRNNELHGFDVSEERPDRYIAGLQDNGFYTRIDHNTSSRQIGFDGENCEFRPGNDNYIYRIGNGDFGKVEITGNTLQGVNSCNNDPGKFAHNDKFLGRPMAIDPNNPDIIYTGRFKGTINRTTNDGQTWQTINVTPVNSTHRIIDIEVAPSSPNIVYAATHYITYGQNSPSEAVYRSTDYGQTWTDITGSTGNTIQNQWGSVTDLTVSWDDPNKIWVSIGGVWKNPTVFDPANRVFRCDDASATQVSWDNMTTNSLSGLPVTAIVNQPGTDRVFIGTDAGIFFWNGNDWECFSSDFPITFIKDLKIKRETSELYAGTYGYGLWKSPLPCKQALTTMLIDSDVTWDSDKLIGKDVHIASNATLTVNSEAVISMGSGAKITVSPGSRLVVDNATLTSGCSELWTGIEVWGTYDKSQLSRQSNGLSKYQGEILVQNGGTIRNALDAVKAVKVNSDGSYDWSKTGGIIRLNDANIINCKRGVWIGGYHNFHPTNNMQLPNASSIQRSNFEVNNNLLNNVTPVVMVALYDMERLSISGTDFINDNSTLAYDERGTAIRAISASFSVNHKCTSSSYPCSSFRKSTFKGFTRAIDASAISNYAGIKNSEFYDCYRGIYLVNTNSVEVLNNYFELNYLAGSNSPHYGIYLDGGTGFKVEENEFTSSSAMAYGIGIYNTGGQDNEIYKNEFSGMTVATYCAGANRNSDGSEGLRIFCNDYDNPQYDIWVDGANKTPKGIANDQHQSDGNGVYYPADNIFTNPRDSDAPFDIGNDLGAHFNYYYFDNSAEKWEPTKYSNIKKYSDNITSGCPSKTGTNDLEQMYLNLSDAQTALNSSTVIMQSWRDGGDVDLPEDISLIGSLDVYDEFNNLMAESPYLSDESLIAVIENESFTSLMVKLLMIANPHCVNSDEVMEALYDREPPLPQNYIDDILDEEGADSQLEKLEDNVAADYHLVRNIGENIKRHYRKDTINTWSTDSLIAFTSRQRELMDRYELASIFLSEEDFDEMNSTLNEIPGEFEFTEEQSIDYEYYLDFFEIAENYLQEGGKFDDLSTSDISDLEVMVNLERPLISQLALSLLKRNNPAYEYEEYLSVPPEDPELMSEPGSSFVKDQSSQIKMKLYPNPAHSYTTIEYHTSHLTYKKIYVIIYDVKGKEVIRKKLIGGDNEELINLSQLKSGVYMIRLYVDNKPLKSKRINILN